MHAGVDLVAPWGTPILAARDGRVKYTGWKGAYGKLVILAHANGWETFYGHCTEFLVREGDEVKAGAPIARLGATGSVTAPHLHFELRQGGGTRNPAKYLARFL
jgi:murein DD-endopeptidase MepM/ murein hydrolase activator NlpD